MIGLVGCRRVDLCLKNELKPRIFELVVCGWCCHRRGCRREIREDCHGSRRIGTLRFRCAGVSSFPTMLLPPHEDGAGSPSPFGVPTRIQIKKKNSDQRHQASWFRLQTQKVESSTCMKAESTGRHASKLAATQGALGKRVVPSINRRRHPSHNIPAASFNNFNNFNKRTLTCRLTWSILTLRS